MSLSLREKDAVDWNDPSKLILMRPRPSSMRAPPGARKRSSENASGKTNKRQKAQKESSSRGNKRARGATDVDDPGHPIARSRNISSRAEMRPASSLFINSHESPAAAPPSQRQTESRQGPTDRTQQPGPSKRKSKPWSSDEDELLAEGVQKHGMNNWKAISELLRVSTFSRTPAQCRARLERGGYYARLIKAKAAEPKAHRSQEADEGLFQASRVGNHDVATAGILTRASTAGSVPWPSHHQAAEPSAPQAATVDPVLQSGEQHLQYSGVQPMPGNPQYWQNYEQSYEQNYEQKQQPYHQPFMQPPSSIYSNLRSQQQQLPSQSLLEPLGHEAQEHPAARYLPFLSSVSEVVQDQQPQLPQGMELPFLNFLGTPKDSEPVNYPLQLIPPSNDPAEQQVEPRLVASIQAGMHFFDTPSSEPLNDTTCLHQQQNAAAAASFLPAPPAGPLVLPRCPPSTRHPLLDSDEACEAKPEWLEDICEDEALPEPPSIGDEDCFSFPVPSESFITSPVGIPNNGQLLENNTDSSNQQDETNLGIPIRHLVEQPFPEGNEKKQQQQQPMTMTTASQQQQQQQPLKPDQTYYSSVEEAPTEALPSRSDVISTATPSNIHCSSSSLIFASAGNSDGGFGESFDEYLNLAAANEQ